MRRLVFAAVVAWAGCSPAFDVVFTQPDGSRGALGPAGFGTGRDGAIVVSQFDTVLNTYAAVVSDAEPGARDVAVDATDGFVPGALVMVWNTTGLPPVTSGDATPIAIGAAGPGHQEFARVEAVAAGVLRLSAPLAQRYPAMRSQIVRVIEPATLQVLFGASLVAKPWDGARGGIVAVVVRDLAEVPGAIRADFAGFRGGEGRRDAGGMGCEGLDRPSPGTAAKGEGLVLERYGPDANGRGNVANGGGGGLCHNSGGGGGGHVGPGGHGGFSSVSDGERDVGGLGGAPLDYQLGLGLMVMGGGGGAGHANMNVQPGGGRGGGVVFIRARRLDLSGVATSRGESAKDSAEGIADGASGGGAGGAILLRSEDLVRCGPLTVIGGNGANTPGGGHGPGGGGGGGVMRLAAPRVKCATTVSGGIPGKAAGFGSHGATRGGDGRADVQVEDWL